MKSTVRDIMTTNVVTVHASASFKDIAMRLRENRVSAFPVLDDDGTVIGVVSEADLLLKEAFEEAAPGDAEPGILRGLAMEKARARTAADLMSQPAVTVAPEDSVEHAARLMYARGVKRVPVTDAAGQLVGIVSRADVLSVFGRPDEDIRKQIVDEVICGEFRADPGRFTVRVKDGVVTMTGRPGTVSLGRDLLARARHVQGVVAVRDRFTYPPPDGSLSFFRTDRGFTQDRTQASPRAGGGSWGPAWGPARGSQPPVRQVQPDQAALQVTDVQAGGRGEAFGLRNGLLPVEQAEVAGARGGARVQRRGRPGPHATQLAQEQPHGHRPPAGQDEQGRPQRRVVPVPGADHRRLPVVALIDELGQVLQAGGGAEVVAGVAARVEQPDQVLGRHVPRLADADQAGGAENGEGVFGDGGGDPRPEEGGGQEPALHLGVAGVDVDAEFGRETAAEPRGDLPGELRLAGQQRIGEAGRRGGLPRFRGGVACHGRLAFMAVWPSWPSGLHDRDRRPDRATVLAPGQGRQPHPAGRTASQVIEKKRLVRHVIMVGRGS